MPGVRWTIMLAGVLLVPLGVHGASTDPEPLLVYCAAGIKNPVVEVARLWEEETGQEVQLQFGGSGTLLNNLALAGKGDIYIAAEESYFQMARERGLVREVIPFATQQLVIAVPEGNPASINSLDDLAGNGVRISMPNPEAAAAGKVAKSLLQSHGLWESISGNTKVFKPTVGDVAVDVRLGAVDAAITWDTTASQFDGIEAVHDPRLQESRERVGIGVLESTKDPARAISFARFVGAADRGQVNMQAHGFGQVEGDDWSSRPRLILFAGAMLHPAIEARVDDFARREGVDIERVYNGCGMLVSQMKAGSKPDAYFACDRSFLDLVSDRFEPGIDVSTNSLVILVPAGNPRNIQSLSDLVRPGTRVGISHPEQSALGALTRKILLQEELHGPLEASGNIRVVSPTGEYLVNQFRVGGLDAVVVYGSNANASAATRETCMSIPLDLPGSIARQPWAVSRDSSHARTMSRLYEALSSEESADHFRSLGFGWVTSTGQ